MILFTEPFATCWKMLGSFGALASLAFALAACATAQERKPEPTPNPWGISSSASSIRNCEEWLPKMAAVGARTVRLFPEWRDFEPSRGNWKWERADKLVDDAAKNHIEISAILMGATPSNKQSHAFPMEDLSGWSNYVSTVVGRYKSKIRYWEVWNEGNGGFNDGHHGPSDYAKLAVASYEAAKKADPNAKVGLTVASFDPAYLKHTIRAMAKDGKPDRFDYLCIHPYEIADGLADPDGEIPFLWMSHTIREMLKANAPERARAEIWITEVARRIESKKGRNVTERDAAKALVKIYTMAIAQGIACTQWFEAQDPIGEDQGFGLIARNGSERVTYRAFKTLAEHLGPTPKYLGWLATGPSGKGYGFAFAGKAGPVLVTWLPAHRAEESLTFSHDIQCSDPLAGISKLVPAGQKVPLSENPTVLVGLSPELLKEAEGNAARSFPWGGDYSKAQSISCEPGNPEGNRGIFQTHREDTPAVKFADGSSGILLKGDIGQSATFYVHPSFANFQTTDYYVRVRVGRIARGNLGMNLFYEIADSQGRSPYKNREQWFGVPEDAEWRTHTWHVTDACFARMWGHDFAIRPEQSVPFVLGKVEVSIVPFE